MKTPWGAGAGRRGPSELSPGCMLHTEGSEAGSPFQDSGFQSTRGRLSWRESVGETVAATRGIVCGHRQVTSVSGLGCDPSGFSSLLWMRGERRSLRWCPRGWDLGPHSRRWVQQGSMWTSALKLRKPRTDFKVGPRPRLWGLGGSTRAFVAMPQ